MITHWAQAGDAVSILQRELERSVERLDSARWEKLRGAHIFFTGATGFFGPWVLRSLLHASERHALGLQITLLTRNMEAFTRQDRGLAGHPAIHLVQGDVRDFDFPRTDFTHLIHGAATSARETFDGMDPLSKFDVTLLGARRVLDFAVERRIPRLLMLSSGAYYGALPADADRFSEDCPIAPDPGNLAVAIGHAKRAAEFLSAHYAAAHGLSISTARCFSFVGPLMPLDIHYAIGNFIRDALWQDAVIVEGDGTAVRSYLHVGDLAAWLIALLVDGAPGRAYNVGSDRAITMYELARETRDLLCPGKQIRVLGAPEGVAVRNVYVPDIGRARSELGLDNWTALDDALALTADVARAQRPA